MQLHWVMVEGRRAGNLCVFKIQHSCVGAGREGKTEKEKKTGRKIRFNEGAGWRGSEMGQSPQQSS